MVSEKDRPTELQAAYDLLEVARDSTPTEIRKSYLQLVFIHHPDRFPGKDQDALRKRGTQTLAKINAAYKLIQSAPLEQALHPQADQPPAPTPTTTPPPQASYRPPVQTHPPATRRPISIWRLCFAVFAFAAGLFTLWLDPHMPQIPEITPGKTVSVDATHTPKHVIPTSKPVHTVSPDNTKRVQATPQQVSPPPVPWAIKGVRLSWIAWLSILSAPFGFIVTRSYTRWTELSISQKFVAVLPVGLGVGWAVAATIAILIIVLIVAILIAVLLGVLAGVSTPSYRHS